MNAKRVLPCILLCATALAGAAEPDRAARDVMELSGAKAGLCVQLDCSDGRLLAAVAGTGRFLAHGLSADPQAAAATRKSLADAGMAGVACVETMPPARLPYADNLVNLLVAEDLPGLLAKGLKPAEILRVLCPGGTACLGVSAEARRQVEGQMVQAGVEDVRFEQKSRLWLLVTKPRPSEMDDWTHPRHGPDGNPVSHDLLIDRPNRIRWIMGQQWGRQRPADVPGSGSAIGMRSAGGRNYYVMGKGGPFSKSGSELVARDAFNGVMLWTLQVPGLDPRFVLASDTEVYLLREGELAALDGATGGPVRTYGKPDRCASLVLADGLLLCADAKALRAFEARTGKEKWSSPAGAGRAVVVAGGRAFCGGSSGPACLDLATGELKWQARGGQVAFAFRDKLLLCSSTKGANVNYGLQYTALAAEDGSPAWSHVCDRPEGRYPEVYFAGGLVWVQGYDDRAARKNDGFHNPKGGVSYKWEGLDPDTGKVARSFLAPVMLSFACHPRFVTDRFQIGIRPLYFTDWKEGSITRFEATRGACQSGFGLGNGMFYGLYTDSPMCNCVRPAISGVTAFDSDGKTIDGAVAVDDTGRLETGPAEAPKQAPAGGAGDWPTYRHDGRRSAAGAGPGPGALEVVWSRKLLAAGDGAAAQGASAGTVLRHDWLLNVASGDPLSQPVVADGKVFVALTHAGQVVAMNEKTGQVLWRFLAPGRLDAPPTIHRGLCLVGCHDGWVYALRADDGRRVWRFRAAPAQRRIVAYGQVESAWPVVGGVLVVGEAACVVVGRTTEADGGLYVHAVDAATGKSLWAGRRVKPDDGPVGAWNLRGHKDTYYGPADVLCSDGKSVAIAGHIRGRFDAATGRDVDDWSFGVHFGWMRSQYASQNQSTQHPPISYLPGRTLRPLRIDDKQAKTRTHYVAASGGRGWKVPLPEGAQIEALALAGEAALAALSVPAPEPGGEVWLLSAADGVKAATRKLPAPPVLDGLAAANGKAFLALMDGTVMCLGGK